MIRAKRGKERQGEERPRFTPEMRKVSGARASSKKKLVDRAIVGGDKLHALLNLFETKRWATRPASAVLTVLYCNNRLVGLVRVLNQAPWNRTSLVSYVTRPSTLGVDW